MRMPKIRRGGGILSAKIFAALIAVVAMVGVVVPMVHAEPEGQIITVHPGKNTLKDALKRDDLKDGDILQLEAGSYTSDPAEDPATITKAITIKGYGSSLSGSLYTTLSVPLIVDLDDANNSKQVTLQGFASSNQTVTPGYKFITVNSPVDLTISDVRDWGIHRGDFVDHDAMSLYVKSDAEGAKIKLNNIEFFNGTLYGIRVEASNTEINIEGKSNISGRTAISLANGSNNQITAVGTEIYGRYNNYTSEEVIDVNQQTGSTLTFENCNITSSASKSTAPSIISLKNGKNTNTTINLKGATKITDSSSSKNSDSKVIYRFADDATNSDNNIVNIDPGVTIKGGDGTDVDVPHKYNIGANYAVVGVYDYTGKGTVKVYDNETQITDMKDETAEGYKHKGWFKSTEFLPESVINDKIAHSGVNFDAYQQAVELVSLTIKDVPDDADGKQDKIYKDIEKGQTISQADQSEVIKQDLEKIQKAYPEQEFQHYILTDDAKEDEARTFESVDELDDVKIEKDSTIEANHDVKVTINGNTFYIEAGETLAKIRDEKNPDGYEEAKFKNDEKDRGSSRDTYFWHFVDADNNVVDEDTTPITSNIELTTKYYFDVKVEGNSQAFKVGDGEPISRNESAVSAMNKIKACETSSSSLAAHCRAERFSHFVDADHDNAVVSEETHVNDDMTIKAVFDIEIQIGDQKFLIDADTKINDADEELKGKIEEALNELQNVSAGQEIKSIIISPVGAPEQENETFIIPTNGEDVDALISAIMDYKLSYYDVVIYPVCEVTITIKGAEGAEDQTFKIETGKKLSDIEKQSEYKEKYEQAIYRDNKERFYRLAIVAEDGSESGTFDMESEIHASITLRPKFFYTVTLKPLNGEPVEGYVEEGTAYNAFILDNAKDATNTLFAIESNQGHDTEEGVEDTTHLHYEGLKMVNEKDEDVKEYQDKVNQDIIISGIYHYDLDIVTNYDDPSNNLDKYTINFENKPAETDNNTQIQESLKRLKESVENDQRKFYTFYNEKGIDEHKEIAESEILDTVHTSHLYITAKVAYKVQIGDTVGYVPEGKTIADALAEDMQNKVDLVKALQDLKNPGDKIWREWDIKAGNIEGESTDENMITSDTIINQPTEIGAKYNVKIEIGGTPFIIEENDNLNSLSEPDKQNATKALEALMENDNLSFDQFSTGDKTVEEVMGRTFSANTTITASHKIQLFIDDGGGMDVHDTDTLNSLEDQIVTYKNSCNTKDQTFSRFVLKGTDTTFGLDQTLSTSGTNVYLETKCGYTVTAGDSGTTVVAEPDKTLDSYTEFMQTLESLKQKGVDEGKTFSRYIDSNNEVVTPAEYKATKDTTITPIFSLTIDINGVDGESMSCTIDENAALGTCKSAAGADLTSGLETFLAELEGKTDKKFTGYEINEKDKVARIYNGGNAKIDGKENLKKETFATGATITAKYDVDIKIGNDTITMPYGSTASEELKSKMDSYEVPTNKSSIAYFVNSDEEQIDKDTTQFKKNTELTPKYNVLVKIDGVLGNAGEEILEGSTISAAAESMKELAAKDITEQRRFKNAFKESKYDLNNTPINENIGPLTPLYEIDVEINGDKSTIDEGQTLTNHEKYKYYISKEGFEEFRDENGTKVDANTALHKHSKFTAIYVIYVTVPEEFADEQGNNQFKLESTQTIGDLNSTLLGKLKANDANGRTFNRFVDENGKTIDEDTPLTENISITPKYNNVLTFKPYADSEQVSGIDPAEFKVELGEGLTLNDLSTENYGKLMQWLSNVSTTLAAQGKPDYNPTSYLLEVPDTQDPDDESLTTTLPVNLDETKDFKNGDVIRAVFTYNPAPVVPDTPTTPTTDSAQNVTPKAPNTGVGTNDNTTFAVAGAITLIVTISALAFEFAQRGHLRK